jgi:hypothetical protein
MRSLAIVALAMLPAASAFAFNPQPDPPSEAGATINHQLRFKAVCPAGIICCCSGKPRFMPRLKGLKVIARPGQPRLLLPAK